MIFSRFFTPAHASKNQQTRKQAVVSLSPDNPEHRRILHELAFNDESGEVSLAALRQLNSFVLWQKMAEIARDANVKRQAKAWVENAVLSASSDMTMAEKTAFLVESAAADMQSKALHSDWLNELPADTIVVLLKQLQQPEVNLHVYKHTDSSAVRSAIVTMTDEHNVLNRLLKRAKGEDKQVIEAKLQALITQQQRPVEVEQATTMVLSKLQALLDKTHPELLDKKQRLQSDYQTLANEFAILSIEARETFVEKYTQILQKLERHVDRLQPEWAEQLASQAQAERTAAVIAELKQCKQDVTELLQQAQPTDDEIDAAIQAITKVMSSCEDVTVDETERLRNELTALQSRLKCWRADETLAAEIARKLAETNIAELEVNQDSAQLALQLLAQVDELVKQAHYLPEQVQGAIKETRRRCAKIRQQIKQQSHEKFAQCRKVIGVVNNLLASGKYRPALLRFSQLTAQFETLDESAQQRLSKQYLSVKEQVERLSDWQSFLAGDKQPELLAQAKELAAQHPNNIDQRIRVVKDLRQQWQSLSTPGETDAIELNEKFDKALELAFEPCRKHFAELEARKKLAVEKRQAIIEQAKQLSQIDDMKALDKALAKLKEAWQNAGHVDANQFAELNVQWLANTQTVVERLNEWYGQNRADKEQLLRLAQQLLNADHDGRSDEAKTLQRKWKGIGFAGRKVDSKLWRAFRKANDDLFAQLEEARQSQRDQANKAVAEVSAIGVAILSKAESSDVDTAELSAEFDRFNEQIDARELRKSSRLKRMSTDIARKLQYLRSEQHAQQRAKCLASMIDLLTQWSDTTSAEQLTKFEGFAELPRSWQKALSEANSQHKNMSREQLLVKLEIALQLPTPAEFEALRSETQLTMLADRLGGGDSIDAEDLWHQYLACGALSDEQRTKELLRLEPIVAALLNAK